jgi:hypothetical protein
MQRCFATAGARRVAMFARVFTVVAALAAVSACDKSPVEPFDGVKKIEVSGPAAGAPGQTLRYVATAHYADGSTGDVTADAGWRANAPQIAFSSAGVATAKVIGETDVEATFHIFKAQLRVLVLEPGTFKLSGTIRERGGGSAGSAKIYVLSGVGQDKQAFGGEYRIYGVAGPLRVEVSKTGYFTSVHDIDVTGHVVRDFEIVHLETPVDVAGNWTLTLGPPPAGCPDGLPAAAHTRSYNVGVIQTATRLALQLRSPTLQVADDFYTGGTVSGQRVTLYFGNPENDFGVEVSTNLIDRLSSTETFSFTGQLIFQGNESPIATTLDGRFRYWSGPVTQPPSWECRATNYPVTLRR